MFWYIRSNIGAYFLLAQELYVCDWLGVQWRMEDDA